MRFALLTVALLAAPTQQDDLATALAGWVSFDVGKWKGLIHQDPFTDVVDEVMFRLDDDTAPAVLICEAKDPGIRFSLAGFPRMDVDTAGVEFRIGREPPRNEVWNVTTGTEASSVTVPDQHVACVLRSGRLVVRVQGYVRIYTWESGSAFYDFLSRRCFGAGR